VANTPPYIAREAPLLTSSGFERCVPVGTHVLPAQNKSDKITFSKSNFLPLKN